MAVRIYRPTKSPMQSGKGKSNDWVLEYEPTAPKLADNLMGWLGSNDINQQVRLKFPTCDDAVAYAERKGLDYEVIAEATKKPVGIKNYSANFSSDKLEFGRF